MKPTTILLVDDHAVMRMGLVSLLETCRDVEVIGDTGDGESAIRKALKLRPDVVIMDLMMPEMDGVETTRRLLEKWPEANASPSRKMAGGKRTRPHDLRDFGRHQPCA